MLLTAISTWLFVDTRVAMRFRRDVMRMVAEDNIGLLEAVQANVQLGQQLLQEAEDAEPPKDRPYLVVSLEEHRIWLKGGPDTLFTTQVATGSGKTLVKEGGDSTWKFETPRGRLTVQSKEKDPVWQPPDWHFVEQARKRGLAVARVEHGGSIRTSDGGVIRAEGADLVKRYPDGRRAVLDADDGREIVADGQLIIPPLGTNQRRYKGVLGTHRLNLGNGYALHGTNKPRLDRPLGQPRLHPAAQRGHREAVRHGPRRHADLYLLVRTLLVPRGARARSERSCSGRVPLSFAAAQGAPPLRSAEDVTRALPRELSPTARPFQHNEFLLCVSVA